MRYKIDFKKELKIDHRVSGFVAKITDPKAKRKETTFPGVFTYWFETNCVMLDEDSCSMCDDGIYEVIDICKWYGKEHPQQWNIYLVVIDNGELSVVAQYLDNPHTEWVREAKKSGIVTRYFEDGSYTPIEFTPQPEPTPYVTEYRSYCSPGDIADRNLNKRVEVLDERTVAVDLTSNKKTQGSKMSTQSKKKDSHIQKSESTSTSKKSSDYDEDEGKDRPAGKKRKGGVGRPQEKVALKPGEARVMTFTGMVIGVYPIVENKKSYIVVETAKGKYKFDKETKKQLDAEKPRFANKVEYLL